MANKVQLDNEKTFILQVGLIAVTLCVQRRRVQSFANEDRLEDVVVPIGPLHRRHLADVTAGYTEPARYTDCRR